MRLIGFYSVVIIFPIVFAILTGCSSTKSEQISKKDVQSAQKLFGIRFTENTIDTLLPYLESNAAGYDSMRLSKISNETFPAILFNPLPSGYTMPIEYLPFTYHIKNDVHLPDNKEDLAFYTVGQLASLLKHKKISSVELTQLYLSRLKKYNSVLKCVISYTEDLALKQANMADQEIAEGKYRGPLHGIPYGIKDLVAVKGYKTTWGAEPYKNQVIEYNAEIVTRLEKAGAVLIAKLSSGSLARGDVWFGGKTLNPWDTTQGASGSSAGSAAATAAGLVGFSIGTETMGSITSPSNRNGVTGLRPSYGRVSRFGVMSLSWSLDKIGPICRSAEDCAIVFNAIYGYDAKDPTLIEAPFNFDPYTDITLLNVGYLKKDIEKDTTEVKGNNLLALEVIRSSGIRIKEIELPKNLPYDAFDIILRAESGAYFDELVRSSEVDKLVQQNKRSRANSLRQSRFIPAVEYLQANRHRKILIEEMHKIMKDLDVLIAPTFGSRQMLITNLTGHPAITVPTGLDEKGRPTSITFIGNLFDEGKLIRLASEFQNRTGFENARPPGFD